MAAYSAYTDLKIGTSVGGLTAVTALTYSGAAANCPPPKVSFQQFAEVQEVANGNLRGLGKPIITWRLRHVPYKAVQALRDLITDPNLSGTIYIASPDKDGNIQNWQAVVQWPLDFTPYEAFDYWESLTLVFKRCVQQ